MSNDFTYEKPDEKIYHKTLLLYLKKKGDDELHALLKNAKCTISESGTFSRKRWNALYTTIIFHIPIDDLDLIDDSISQRLIKICDMIMPKDVGFEVMHVDLAPSLTNQDTTSSLENDLDDIKKNFQKISSVPLPEDLISKGQEMAEVYLYLYIVENYLRIFIEKVAIGKYGPNYMDHLIIPTNVKRGIETRKKQEAQNQWISVRGKSELFYLDFKELGIIISNNWELFKFYFPQQAWINTKIDELGNCRNLIAHNSYIGKHEKDVIRVNFNSITKQLSSVIQ